MPKTSMKPKSEYAIQTVTNALRMLEVFHSESEMGVSDLARKLGLHKNNAFRLLATLELAGYIQQTESTELYHLGPRCLELGHAFARSHTLMNQARPMLEDLAAETGETAHLAVLRASQGACQVVHLDGVLPDQLVLTGLRVGERIDAHCTALGKTLLAGQLDRRRFPGSDDADARAEGSAESISGRMSGAQSGEMSGMPNMPPSAESIGDLSAELAEATRSLTRQTENTICDSTKLIEEIGAVAMRGYGTDFSEYALGLNCVAAPVRDASARVIAAISLSGPSMRLDEAAVHGPASVAIRRAAARLSSELGAREEEDAATS